MHLIQIVLCCIIFINLSSRCNTIEKLKIGGIFNASEETEEIAFQHAIRMANNYNQKHKLFLTPETVFVDDHDVLKTSKAACQLLQSQVVAIFGPSSGISSPHVQSMCDTKEMPHIETHWDFRKTSTSLERNLVNLHPHPATLSKVYVDIVRAYKWKTFTILYDTDASLAQVDELLLSKQQEFQVQIRQLDLDNTWSYRTVLNVIKKSGEVNFVLACEVDVLEDFLLQAQHVGLITERFNYLVMNLDMHTLDLVAYQYAGCNITGVRLIDPELNDVIEVADSLSRIKQKLGKPIELASHLAAWKINVKTALLIDAVALFYETLKDFHEAKRFEPKTLYCNATDNWEHGYSIINNMKTRIWNGLTGQIKFDHHGVRSEFLLDMVELTEGGLIKVGTWNSTDGLNITRTFRDDSSQFDEEGILQNKSFIVITALTEPYGFLTETTTQLLGNERFEGFGIDLIHELSLMLGFNYTFVIQEDGANGNYNRETKQWNGMIREIIDGRAHLAITDLTITSERQGAVDFTMPFMNLGISILYRKPEPVPPSLFTFASPFSIQVWMLLGVAYFFVSFSLFIIGRLCPSEWTNPYPCVEEPEFLINQFTLKNSLWFTIGSLMQQGTEIAPIGMSTRMVAGIWWFFTLIMVSSYTANLAAFLTIETLVTSFKNIDELAAQTEIKYGAKQDGATSNFFRDSDLESYKTIWKYMYKNPDVMTTDNDIGVKRVEKENYAFLMESTTIEYMVERHCALAQVGGLLDDKGYGIAMKKDSKYRNILSAAVLKLQETGKLTALKIKWWKEKRGGGQCAGAAGAAGQATPLDLKNVEGVFFILTVGTILGFVGTFVELAVHILHKNYKNKRKLRENFKETYLEELRFIFKFKERVRRLQPEKSENGGSSLNDSNELMRERGGANLLEPVCGRMDENQGTSRVICNQRKKST